MARPPRPPEEVARRRELRRRRIRRRRITALAVLLLLIGGGVGAAVALSGGSSAQAGGAGDRVAGTTTGGVTAGSAAPVAHRSKPDGSLGARNVRLACTLLSRADIKAQFGGPVGRPTPMWPYCQWTIGRDAWLAVWVGPKTPFADLRKHKYVLENTGGVGDDAFFGTDRYLYFSGNGASYYVLYQKRDEFTELHKDELIALARTILGKPLDLTDAKPAGTGSVAQVTLETPTRKHPLRVFFGGGSLSAGPEWALWLQVEKGRLVRPFTEYQVGTGLIRSDYFDWRRHLEGVVRAVQPQIAVFMAGANDSQDFLIKGKYYPYTTETWHREYRKRVARVMDELTADGRKVLWVAMPPMRDPKLNAGMVEVNEIGKSEAAKRSAVTYVDTWKLFSAPGGGYTDTLPDASGSPEQVRLEDGIHLNVPGSERLAKVLLTEIGKIAGDPGLAGAA